MADGYINLEINLDAQKALQNANDFAAGVKGKLSEIDAAAKRTNDIINGGVDYEAETAEMRLMKQAFGNMPIDTPINTGVFEKIKPVFEGLNTALTSMKDGLTGISNVINSGNLTGSMTRLFETMYRTMSSSMKKITDYTNSFSQKVMDYNKPIDVTRFVGNNRSRQVQLAAASGMKAAADARYLANLIDTGDFGVSRAELDDLIPAIKRYTTNKVNFAQSGMRGTGTIDDIAGILSQREDFQKVVRGASGKKLTVPQLKNIAKLFAASQGYAGQSSRDFLDAVGFDEELKLFQSDYFPDKAYAKAFKGYGNPFSDIQGNANGKARASVDAYHSIWNLVRNGNQQAIRLAQQVGLVRARNGKYEYTSSASQAQMETLAGLAMQSIHDAKSSLPFHYADPDDISNEHKIINRQNKVYQADMEIIEALHKAGISPNVYSGYTGSGSTNVDDIIRGNSAFNFVEEKKVKGGQRKYNKRFVNIGTLGTKDMFVIPQTVYGEGGALLVRDPKWQKENGVKAQAEDHFVTIGRSALTDMLGMTGNNTYGYGRENGRAKYATPKLFRIDTSGLYEEYTNKDHRLDVRIKEGKEKEAERLNKLFNREITEKYGDEEYIAAYGDETSITMMLKSEYDRINREAKEAGLASPLENMNIGGRFAAGKYSADMKAIDLQKKFATPGHLYSELGYKKSAPLTALVDFTSFYDLAGVPKANQILRQNQRLDGVTFYDPRVMPFNAQMREGLIDKYLGVREDWRQLLSEGGYLQNAFESGENPGLIVKNDKNASGFSFYMPQVGLGRNAEESSKRVQHLVSRMNYLQRRQNKFSRFNQLNDANSQNLLFDQDEIDELNRLSKDADVLSLQNGLASKEAEILQRIRDTYFYDVMDKKWEGIMSDTAVKNEDKWRISSGENFKTLRKDLLDEAQRKSYDELIKQNKTDEAERLLSAVIPAAVQGKQKAEWLTKNADGTFSLNIADNDIVELTAEQQARHLQAAGKKYGLWINNSAEDFSVKKDFIPEQLATSMGIGIKERTASTVAYNEYISALKNDEVAQQEYLASIPLGRLLLASGQHKGSLAQRLIGSRITDMEEQRQEGGIYAPDNDIIIGLTAPKAGSTINPIFKGLFGTGADTSTEIGKMIQKTSDAESIIMQTLSDDELSKLKGNAQIARMMLSRMPAAPGEFSPDSENLGDVGWIRKAMQRLGMDTRNTIYTDPRLQYKLMTGDYDGDTAWVIRGLSSDRVERMKDIAYKKREAAKKINDQYGEEGISAPERDVSPGTRFTDSQIGGIRSKLEMGTSAAAIRNAMQLSDDDPTKWATIAQAITEYDFATSESKKKGQSLRMSKSTSDAVMEGALFRRFIKEINSFANDPDHARTPRIFSARLPLLNEETELADAAFNFKERRTGGTVGDTFGAHLDEWLTETYGNAQTGEAKAARHYAELMKNITGGKRLNTQADIAEGRQIAFDWHNELEERRQAGENVSEELAHWNSYLSRLKSAEDKGATYENVEKRKEGIDNKIKELEGRQNLTKEENQQLENLRGLSTVYGELMVPFSDRMKKVDEQWDAEVQTFRDAVQKRVEENQKAAEKRGLDTSHNRGLMNQVFARNPEAAAAMNWSDVTPWMYEVLQKEKSAGNPFALSGIKTRNLITGLPGRHPEEEFNPYPHNEFGIENNRVKIMARELTKNIAGLEQFGYQTTGATLMGSIRHGSFQNYLEQIMQGNLTANISDMYATALQKAGYDGVDLEVENVDGKIVLKGLDSNSDLQEGINNALGTFNKQTGQFENGTLDAFAKNIILSTINAGGRIANIEGANYFYGKDPSGKNFIDKGNVIKGRGTPITFPIKYKDAAGYEHIKEGTFAPDLIMGNANGTFDMYDYKSSEPGSIDSLFQMMVYAGDIKQKANEWRQYQGNKRDDEYKKAKKAGWLQYVDDQGNLKFNGFHGYDTKSGVLYDYEITSKNQNIIDTVLGFYHKAQEAKMDSARSGEYQKAIDYIQDQLDAGNIDIQRTKRKGLAERVMQSSGFKTDTYRNYVAQKILKDEEELDEINSFLYKKDRQMNNFDSGGFSPYSSYRQKLDEMVAPGRMNELKKEWGDTPEAQKEIDAYTQRVENMRKRLADIETQDSVESFKSLHGDIRQLIYGTKDSASLGIIESVQRRILNAAAVREGMKDNKDLYSQIDQKWISKEAEKRYSESIDEQKKVEDEFNKLIPSLTEKQITQNQRSFESLLPKDKQDTVEESIQEYYNRRYDNIQKFIQQQEADIDKYQAALNKSTTINGKQVNYYQGEQRKAIKALLDDAKKNRDQASDILLGNDVKAAAVTDYEKSIGLSFGSKTKKTSELQQEYLDLIVKQHDEEIPSLQKSIRGKKAAITRERNKSGGGNADKIMQWEQDIQNMQDRINQYTAKYGEYDILAKQRDITAQSEQIDDRIAQIQVDKMLGRNPQYDTRELAIQSETAKRYKLIASRLNDMNEADARAFLKDYRPEDVEAQVRKEFSENEYLASLTRQHQLDAIERRGTYDIDQMRFSQEQFKKQQRRRYSRSRIAQSLYGLEDRKTTLQQQIQNYELQRADAVDRQKEYSQRLNDYVREHGGDAEKLKDDEKYKELYANAQKNQLSINNFNGKIAESQKEIDELSTAGARMQAVFGGVSQTLGMVAHRLGRQLFMKALQETKRFVKEFDASMNEIQAITLKSDKEMASVRSQTINKALGLRTSVSNVATTEAALYRQGLSDAEVSSRTESIIKFATVTKLNVAEATKIITTALQNDLVPSAEAAMDALVALGDSAATTAAEIGKGMQKAAASAKVAGVSYAELTALLTIGTSDTQLSGTQVGTALQTVFSRMRRLSISGYTDDQNGEKTTASDAEAALKSVGVDLWDNKTIGKMRSAYDVLSDLSKVWQNLSDAQKNIVMNAMAGTRQTNIFSTLMEGMSEDGGETLEKYLGLAEGSEGITQSKYEIAMQSLSAAMDELKSSWDAVVESFVSNGTITGILDGVSGFLQNVANIAQSGNAGKIGTIFSAIAAGITGLGVAAMASMAGLGPVAAILGVIAGLVTGGIGVALSKGLSSLISPESYEDIEKRTREEDLQRITDTGNIRSNTISKKEDAIQKVEKYASVFEKFKNQQDSIAKSDASRDLIISLNELSDAFPNLNGPIQDSINNLENWKEAIIKAKEEVDNLKNEDKKQSVIDATDYIATHGDALYSEYLKQYTGKRKPLSDEELEILENSQKGKKFQGLISGDKLFWEGSAAVDLSNDQQKVEYFQNLIGYYAQDDVIKIIGKFIQNSDIENAFNKGSTLMAEKDPSKRVRLLKNEDMIKIVNDLLYQYSDEIVDPSSLTQEELTSIGLNYIENALIPALSNSFTKNATEKYSADYLKTAFLNGIKKEIMNEESEYTFFKDGIIDNNEISRYFEDFLHSETGIDKTVENNLEKENYDYYIEDNSEKGFVGFTSEDEASEYARKHGIPIANIKSGKGNSAYQTAKQRISAKRQEANANSRQTLLENLMYGYEEGAGFNLLSEEEQRFAAFERARKFGGRGSESEIEQMRSELMKMSSEQGIETYGSIYKLEQAAKEGGWDADLANAISGNSNAMAAYLANDYDALVKSLQEEIAGKSTPQSRADLMRSFGSMFSGNRAAVESFRKEGLTSDAYKQWQSFFGDNADLILDELAAGTLEQNKALYDEYRRTLAEKGLKTGTGKIFTGVETTGLAQQILSGGFKDWTEAQEKMTKWTTDEWSALENKYPALKQYMQMNATQRKSQEGQNLLREVQIQMSISGVSELEEANKVLEGTTKLIENIQKGGNLEIKAKVEFESGFQTTQQQSALLQNGTRSEQIETMLALGISQQSIEQDFNGSLNTAKALVNGDLAQYAGTIQQLAKVDRNYARKFAAANGFETKINPMGADHAVDYINDLFGYKRENGYRYDKETGELYYMAGDQRIKAGEHIYDIFNRNAWGKYVYAGEAGEPYRKNLLFNVQKKYNAKEIAEAQAQIISGKMTNKNAEDYDLYQQAVSGLSDEEINYIVARDEYERINRGQYSKEEQAAAYDNYEKAQNRYESWRQLHQKEIDEQQALEDARLAASESPEAAMRYARLQYNQNNKGALAANALYETLSTANVSTAEDMMNLLSKEDNLKNWTELLESAPGLTDEFRRMGHTVDEDGNINWDAIKQQEGGLSAALDDLINIIAGHSIDFKDTTYDTRSDIYEKANRYYTSPTDFANISEDEYNAYAQIVGTDIAARRKRASAAIGENNEAFYLTAQEEAYERMLMENYNNGIVGLTQAQKVTGAEELFNIAQQGKQAYNDVYGNASQDMINTYVDAVPGLREYVDAVKDGSKNEEELAEMATEVASEIARVNAEAKGYGESAKKAGEFAKAIAKGGTAADKAKISLDAQMKSIQDQQTALEQAAGKSGKQLKTAAKKGDKTLDIFSSMFDYSPDQIAEMSKEQIQDLINKAGPMIAEQFGDVVDGLYAALPDNVDVTLPISDLINVQPDGSVDLSALESVLGETAANIIAEIMSLAKQYGAIDLQAELDKGTLTVEGLFRAISAAGVKGGKGYSTGKGGGGGGGGKSATDELLEKQKQRTAELEHRSKLLEIEEKYLDFVNDYSGHDNNIDQQIKAQESLRAAYAENLSELQAQLATVEQGSDDYNKLADAIRSTEEAMASIKNTINELNAKKIQIVQTKQENADKPANQMLGLLGKYAQRYQTSGQFESYSKVMEKTIAESREQIVQNNAQIAEWEDLLKEYYEGSDAWIEVRDKIWAIQMENAELENQIASDTISLQEARVAQIAQDLQDKNMSLQHTNNMLDTFGQVYQSTNQQEHYRDTLAETNENNQRMKEQTDAAIEEVKKQIESMKSTDPARRTALQTLYELEETSAQYEASILQNRQAIEESLINQLTQGHTDTANVFEHELKLLKEAEKEFLNDDDFVNYQNILAEESRNATQRLDEQKDALADYIALQESDKITEGSTQWRTLEEQIRSTKESIASLKNEVFEYTAALQKAQFETLQRFYKEGVEDQFAGMDQLTHEQNLINFYETRYQSRGELTNYGTALGWERDNLQEQRKAILRQIDSVKALQETHKDNPELYKQETEAIRKYEEELLKVENALEKNEEAQKKNRLAIVATVAAVKKTADSALREMINKQKTMLSATVSFENSILDTLRKRYNQEWALEKASIEKKKQALNEEKSLITDRLNFRKKMMDEETKAEELAEYKRQLAVISADTTRTKEANELRRKINQMEREQAIQNAEDIANAEIKSIQDRSEAWSNYESVREEDLNNWLSDANNFREELDTLLNGSFEDFVNWNAKYNESYIKATDEQRKQMEQGWDDTWYQMLGMLRTYWDEAEEASQSLEGWMALATSTDSFKALSPEEQFRRRSELEDQYNAMLKAHIDNAEFDDQHEILNTIKELKDWTFNVNVIGLEDYLINSRYSTYDFERDHSIGPMPTVNDYAGVGKAYEPEPVAPASSGSGNNGGSGTSSGSGTKYGYKFVDNFGVYHDSGKIYNSPAAAKKAGVEVQAKIARDASYQQLQAAAMQGKKASAVTTYLHGGLVDYTGPAWVDGTKTRPESFLDATDTKLLRGMLDSFDYIRVNTHTPHFDDTNNGHPNVSIGDVHVSLNVDKLESDADYEEIANKVGKVFTKQLQKEGLSLAGYNW